MKIGGVRQALRGIPEPRGALANLSPGARDAAAGIALDRASFVP